jgi:hypothetical protein
MHDAGKVLAGLVVFLAITTSPAWYHAVTGGPTKPPELEISPASRQCVAPTPYMRAFHMDMLNDWRNAAVRTTDTTYFGLDGKPYQKNLEETCLGNCHSNKAQFCDRCHEYVGAEPYCWDCHSAPSGAM